MTFIPITLDGCFIVEASPFKDERGWFIRTYCEEVFTKNNLNTKWLQMNHSCTTQKGTIRGLHFQYPPFQEIKLVRCISGGVLDIVVDLRKDSPTFLKYFGVELTEQNKKSIYIPKGFAHGFQTLTNNTQLVYMHSNAYIKESEGGLFYSDPLINIQWPLPLTEISERDKNHPLLTNQFKGI